MSHEIVFYVQRGGSTIGCDRLRAIEAGDAELAQLMQDEEKLRQQRSRQHSHHQHARQVSDIGPQPHNEMVIMAVHNLV